MIVRELINKIGFRLDNASLQRVEQRVKATQVRMQNIGRRMAFGLTLPIVGLGAGLVKFASDFTETQNKFNQVFKGMEDTANSWADTFSKAVGRSRADTREGLSSYQAMLKGLGFIDEKAFEMSSTLQRLSVDFASFNNLSDAEAQQRFISAMSGSAEVLDRFGVNIRASALDMKLQELGLAKNTAAATENHKAIARLAIITESMTRQGAVGDAIRTLGDFANRMKQVRSLLKDTAVGFGKILIPPLNKFLKIIVGILAKLDKLDETQKKIILGVFGVVAAIGPLLLVGAGLIKTFLFITSAFRAASTAALLFNGSIALIPLAIVAVLAALALFIEDFIKWKEGGDSVLGHFLGSWEDFSKQFTEIFGRAGKKLKDIFIKVTDFIKGIWKATMGVLQGDSDKAVEGIEESWGSMPQFFRDFVSKGIFDVFKELFGGDWKALHERAKNDVELIWVTIKYFFRDLWKSIRISFKDLLIDNIIKDTIEFFNTLGNTINELIIKLFDKSFDTDLFGKSKEISGGKNESVNKLLDILTGKEPLFQIKIPEFLPKFQQSGLGSISNTANVNPVINVTVPPGTPEEQRVSLEQQADEVFSFRFDKVVQNILNSNTPAESQ